MIVNSLIIVNGGFITCIIRNVSMTIVSNVAHSGVLFKVIYMAFGYQKRGTIGLFPYYLLAHNMTDSLPC